MDIPAWLRGLGLGRYEQTFRDNAVDIEVLPKLTGDDLKEMGIVAVGDRRKLLAAIAALHDSSPAARGDANATTAPAGQPPERSSSQAERRQLTLMFVDLVGSTALASRFDPEEMRHLLRGYQNAVAGEVARFAGHVAKLFGDGVLCYFGWPRADEHDAERAVRAGLAVVAAVPALRAPDGEPLAARVGIATGLVVVGELIGEGAAREETVVGETPNLAARLQALADPGAVVVAPATRRLLSGLFEFADLGPQVIKGIAVPVRAARVVRETAVDSRFEARHARALAPIIGRDHELGLLLERWRQAEAGEGQGLLLVGEAGIGKSRTVQALMDALGDRPHSRLRYQCSPYHADSPLSPVVRQLRQAAGLEPEDGSERQLDKLEALLRQGAERTDRVVPLIAALVGIEPGGRYPPLRLTPQQQRARTLAALVDQLLGLALSKPVLCLFEDIHWVDPTTLELVEQALDQIARARVAILLTTRPDNQPALGGHPHVTRLALNRLGRAPTEAMVAGLTGGRALPREVLDHIAARADGVPLYVEEMTKAVLEAGLLRDEGDRYALAGPLPALAVPATLHDSLMARLDRVPGVKEVAQVASCIGREFEHGLVAAVAGLPEAELGRALERLGAAELVFRRGAPPEANYTFKHALVRDAAYASLLTSRRRQLHARILEALEGRSPATAPEVLAHHATEAGLADKAADLWRQAGEAALAKPAYAEAASHFASAIALAREAQGREAQERELALQVQRGQALIAAKGYGWVETVAAFERARELAEALGSTPLLFPALYGDWVGHYVRADFPRGLHRAEAFLAAAEWTGDDAPRLVAHRVLGTSYMIMGELGEARRHLERSLELYRPEEHAALATQFGQDPGVGARCYLAWTSWFLGHPARAATLCAEAEATCRGLTHVNTLAYLHFHVAMPALLAGFVSGVEGHARSLDGLAREHGLALWKAYATFYKGWAQAQQGRESGAVATMMAGLAEARATRARLALPLFLVELAKVLTAGGRVGEAERVLDEALEELEATGQRCFEPELYRVRGELVLRNPQDHATEAEAWLGRALAVARAQRALSWELRAATSLARVWAERGERRQAVDLLAPIHGRFSEGFATGDLVEAKVVLDQLA